MNNFIVYNVALELARALRPIVEQLRTHSSDLGSGGASGDEHRAQHRRGESARR
jgi:hypothetical protein